MIEFAVGTTAELRRITVDIAGFRCSRNRVGPITPTVCAQSDGKYGSGLLDQLFHGRFGAAGSQPAANQAWVIAVAPNKKFLYVGANPVIYPFVVASNGSLTAVAGTPPTVGNSPGSRNRPSTGKFLFASAGDSIFTLSIDQTTGALTAGSSVRWAAARRRMA